MAFSKEIIEEKKKLLSNLISKNKHSQIFDAIQDINQELKSSLLENEVLKLKSRQADFEMNINDPAFSGESMTRERASIRNAIIALKDRTLHIMEHGESSLENESPTPQPTPAQAKTNIVDLAIVILTSLVFIVLLIAFGFALLGKPINIGLIAFASAFMMIILMGLIKYKRDMGKGVYQIK